MITVTLINETKISTPNDRIILKVGDELKITLHGKVEKIIKLSDIVSIKEN